MNSRPKPRGRMIGRIGLGCAVLALAGGLRSAEAEDRQNPPAVAFPTDFRSWTHVKSALVWPETARNAAFSGLHNIYANEAAIAGYRSGSFRDGAVIVFDLFEVEATKDGFEPTRRKAVDVMVRHSASGVGWTFQRFYEGNPSRQASARVRTSCLNCHRGEAEGDMVFSRFSE